MQATLKGLRLSLHLLTGLTLATAVQLGLSRRVARERLVQWWCQKLLGILQIQLQVRGQPAPGARMTVANHVSWLDIPLIAACEGTRFVSKSEVKNWPLIGWLADAAGTFYIRRGKGGARPLLEKLTPHLRAGGSVTIFPEGTTTDGQRVLDFHPRLFAAAIEAECQIQPVAIRYGLSIDGKSIAPFIGDDELVDHLLRVLREPRLIAEVQYLAPIASGTYPSRDHLALAAQSLIAAAASAYSPLERHGDLHTVLIGSLDSGLAAKNPAKHRMAATQQTGLINP